MHALNARREKIALVPLETEVVRDVATRSLVVAVKTKPKQDPFDASALVGRASRSFFDIGKRPEGKAGRAAPQQGPPPAAFREKRTGLIRVVYREIVVRFHPRTSDRTRRALYGADGLVVRRKNAFVRDQVILYHPDRRYAGEQLVEIANRYAESDDVVFASANFVSQYRRQLVRLPRIPVAEWHLANPGGGGAKRGEDVNVRDAWKVTRGKGVVVAVLDDGVDLSHPDLRRRLWRNPQKKARDVHGRDFFLPNDDPGHFDPNPKRFAFPFDQMRGNDIHGTCCAGLVASDGGSGAPIGVAPGSRILAVKVFHADELAQDERVADAIRYAARHAEVLSCSWSGGESPDIEQALEDVGGVRGGRGAVVLCAVGNEEGNPVGFPASDPSAIGVGASTDQGELAWYSNVGKQVAFVAPSSGGVREIFTTDVSTANRGFNLGSAAKGGKNGLWANDFGGTSAATPISAGVAALVLAANPKLTRDEVRSVLIETTDKIGGKVYNAQGHSRRFGHGRINAAKAVARAQALRQRAGRKPKGSGRRQS